MVVMEEKGWARVGQGLTALIAVGTLGAGLCFGGLAVYDHVKSVGAREARAALTDELTTEGRLLPVYSCLKYVVTQDASRHYQGVGTCDGLDVVVNIASTGGKPTAVVVEGFDTRLTLKPNAPYVTNVQRQTRATSAWTQYTAPTPSNP